jgi:hypothetical protein
MREEVSEGCKKELHNKEPHDFYSSPNIISFRMKVDEMGGECSARGGEKFIQNCSHEACRE